MTQIILVRHGQSVHHVAGLTGGWTDTPLTELGRRQAACVAERLARDLPGIECRVLSSDLQRAAQTAAPIAAALGATLEFDPGLREINNGTAAGLTHEASAALRLPRTAPVVDWRRYPGAETWREFFERTAACLERITSTTDRLLILVTHGGTIRSIIGWWLKLSPEQPAIIAFSSTTASLSILLTDHLGRHVLERLNDTSHLGTNGLGHNLVGPFSP